MVGASGMFQHPTLTCWVAESLCLRNFKYATYFGKSFYNGAKSGKIFEIRQWYSSARNVLLTPILNMQLSIGVF